MAENFGGYFAKSDNSPATIVEVVTPSDTEEFKTPTRYLSITGTGDIRVTMATNNPAITGSTDTIPATALGVGQMHPVRVNKIWATGTDAEGIVAWF